MTIKAKLLLLGEEWRSLLTFIISSAPSHTIFELVLRLQFYCFGKGHNRKHATCNPCHESTHIHTRQAVWSAIPAQWKSWLFGWQRAHLYHLYIFPLNLERPAHLYQIKDEHRDWRRATHTQTHTQYIFVEQIASNILNDFNGKHQMFESLHIRQNYEMLNSV